MLALGTEAPSTAEENEVYDKSAQAGSLWRDQKRHKPSPESRWIWMKTP
jgi:hypothetical protein